MKHIPTEIIEAIIIETQKIIASFPVGVYAIENKRQPAIKSKYHFIRS